MKLRAGTDRAISEAPASRRAFSDSPGCGPLPSPRSAPRARHGRRVLSAGPPANVGLVRPILYLAGLLEEDELLDRNRLLQIEMPNRDGFIADPRPDTGSR